jgi:pyruvate ferredoxin oxidoreductase alpha subunit
MEDAETGVILINSAAETAKEAADDLRKKGHKVGVLSPNVLRPFPAEEFRRALKNVKAVTIGDRADSYGAGGGNLSLEVRAALQNDPENKTLVLSRIYGLGGKDFYGTDAVTFFEEARSASVTGKVEKPFAYHGATPGAKGSGPKPGLPPIPAAEVSRGMAKVVKNETTGLLQVELEPMWKMTEVPSRIAPGHGACPGCGIFPTLHQVYRVLGGDLVVLFQTGCAMVVTTGYPSTAHRINYMHNLFQNGAATLSGLVEMYHEPVRRGELPAANEPTFVMITGDGGMDIGIGPALGAAHRRHRMMILEYDNQGYMNTGAQLSYSTPLGHRPNFRRLLPAVRFHGERRIPRGFDAQGGQSAVVRQAGRVGVRQNSVLLPAQLAHRGRRRRGGLAGGHRLLLFPALRSRARPYHDYLRPGRHGAPLPGGRLAWADG